MKPNCSDRRQARAPKTPGNLTEWRKCFLSWSKWWSHGCIYLSKLVLLYIQDSMFIVYKLALIKLVWQSKGYKTKSQKMNRALLPGPTWRQHGLLGGGFLPVRIMVLVIFLNLFFLVLNFFLLIATAKVNDVNTAM